MRRSTVSRAVAAVVLAGLTLVAGTAPASAAPKPKPKPVVVVDGGTLDGGTLDGGTLDRVTALGGTLD